MQLQARDKRALIFGAIVVTLLLAYLLWPRRTPRETSVELVAAGNRSGSAPASPAANSPPPPVAPAATTAPVSAVAAAPAAPIPEGLKLTGVTGGGAIFSFADGSQRLVSRGRDVAPGVTLQAVRLREVILAVGATNYRLGFGGAAIPIQPPPSAGAPTAVTLPVAAPPSPPVPSPATAPPRPNVVMPAPLPNANLAR